MIVARALRRFHSASIVALALTLFISFAHPSRGIYAVQKDDVRIKNFGCVNQNYYRGSQPKRADFIALKKLGIKTVIDLQEKGKEKEADWVRDAGMQYFKIPLSTSRSATAGQTEYFLKLVSNPDHWPVYVHCAAGKHRTGEMTAIYRMTRDSWTADQAYKEMKQYGFYSFPNHGSLKDYVFKYYRQLIEALGQKQSPSTSIE
jgi:protein tyrosine/serine phosphatase